MVEDAAVLLSREPRGERRRLSEAGGVSSSSACGCVSGCVALSAQGDRTVKLPVMSVRLHVRDDAEERRGLCCGCVGRLHQA